MGDAIQNLRELGQSVWYDNISRASIKSGELLQLINLGVSGLTSNPTIFDKAISGSSDYDQSLLDLARDGMDTNEIYETLAIEDLQSAADMLRPTYDQTCGKDGYVSLEVNPHLAHNTEGTITEAKRLYKILNRPNVMVKIPATPEAIPAIHRLIGEGINVNVTLTFSLKTYRDVRHAYMAGLEDLDWSGGDLSDIASVASFFVSRVDTVVDDLLDKSYQSGGEDAKALMGKAAIANAKLAYRDFTEDFEGSRFKSLRSKGARVQRPLWASTSTKNPNYSDVLYAESLVGPDTIDTMPDSTIEAFQDHGKAALTLERDVEEAEVMMDSLARANIDMDHITTNLLADGIKSFADSFDSLLAHIDEKSRQLVDK